jgi:hypothetical protein
MIDVNAWVWQIGLACLGLGLLVGGGYGVVNGVTGLDTCGTSELVADETPETPEQYLEFGNLTAQQQELAEQAISGENPTVTTSDEWPWFEDLLRLQYQGEYYELYTVTTPCPFPPQLLITIGAVTGLAGLGLLAIVSRRFRRSRNAT